VLDPALPFGPAGLLPDADDKRLSLRSLFGHALILYDAKLLPGSG
jgi:hypothetical protein